MSAILDPPTSVLVLGAPADRFESLRNALTAGPVTEVRNGPSDPEDVAFGDEVGCAVVDATMPPEQLRALVDAVRDANPDLPVVGYGDEVGVAGLVAATETLEEARRRVHAAVEAYGRERRRAEESDMFRDMLTDLGKNLYVKDDEARVIHHADVTGGPDPEWARGKTDLEIYGDRPLSQLAYEDDLRVLDGEQVIDREERIPDGQTELWMRTTKVPWRDEDGEVKGLIGHTVDVTEYKQTEHQLEELQHRFNTFTNQLRHELKTQLQIAIGNVPDDPEDERTRRIERALAEMDRIVEDYHTLAKRSLTVEDDPIPADLRETAEAAWSAIEAEAPTFEVDVPPETYVNAPRAMVRNVVENLLRDVSKHAGHEATIRVGTTEDGLYVENPSDTFPESKRAAIEQPGYATPQDGSGRELSVVKDEMDRHLWSLSPSDCPDDGVRLEVTDCLVDLVGGLSPADADNRPPEATEAVGTLEAGGSVERDNDGFDLRVAADGTDIYRKDNDFFFVHSTLSGHATVQAKVVDVERVDDRSKGGLMVRDSLERDATYGYIGRTPTHGSELLWRDEAGSLGDSRQLNDGAVGFDWYRIDRLGNELRMYVSLDGWRWQEVDRLQIDLEGPVHLGLVVCSQQPGKPCEVAFEDVAIGDRPPDASES